MAYEFSPDINHPGPAVSDRQGGQVIEFALGFDTRRQLIVVMAVMLTATKEKNTLELHFGIRRRQPTYVSPPDYSKSAVDRYIPRESREIVKNQIRFAIIAVIPAAMPDRIIMETYYPNLEPKALRKYEAICGAIGICGYELEDEFRSRNGKNYWVFKRKERKLRRHK